jgi:hypothetical protein
MPAAAEPATQDERAPEPFSEEELQRAFVRPHRVIECVLGGKERLAQNLVAARGLARLALLLLLTSLLATVPYGLLSPARSLWKIAVFYAGSLLLCFPSLHVFAQFLGFKFALAQNFALSLVITSVAGLFTFAFAPIIWFIEFTAASDRAFTISPSDLSVLLLGVSLAMGVWQMERCLRLRSGAARERKGLDGLVTAWLVLFVFIAYRMALLLGIVTWHGFWLS